MLPLRAKYFLVWVLALCLSACAGQTERGARQAAAALVREGAFAEQRFDTSAFVIYGLLRPAQPASPASLASLAPAASPASPASFVPLAPPEAGEGGMQKTGQQAGQALEQQAGQKSDQKSDQKSGQNNGQNAAQGASPAVAMPARPALPASPAAAMPPQPPQDVVLHVYVEGDGYAWERRQLPSRDPPRVIAVALRMAQADPTSGPVLYLARPCQYVQDEDARLCATTYWTHGRLSATVIQSMDEAVDMAKRRTGATRVVLVGHSGGGGAAALLASRRRDVDFLGSVGGVLDHKAWTEHHKVSPLRASLNAADQAASLRGLPQRHWTGGKDGIVPSAVNAAFCREASTPGADVCATLPDMTHGGPWEQSWNYDYAREAQQAVRGGTDVVSLP